MPVWAADRIFFTNVDNFVRAPLAASIMNESERIQRAVDEVWSQKTEPRGALGRLEELAARLAVIQRTPHPTVRPARILLFAADHGVARRGVSAFPQEITSAMVRNFLQGGAAINVLARLHGLELTVVNVGVIPPIDPWPAPSGSVEFLDHPIRPGTQDFTEEPAMTQAACDEALEAGRNLVRHVVKDGIRLLILGEMGIGNTTSASALLAALGFLDRDQAVGRGTGVTETALTHKQAMVERALKHHELEEPGASPLEWLRRVGGFEIAAMTGALLEARCHPLPVVVDGFVATAAVGVARAIADEPLNHLIFAHQSAEHPHRQALDRLGANPIFDLEMRLGEGSAAALAVPILESACHLLDEMETIEKLMG